MIVDYGIITETIATKGIWYTVKKGSILVANGISEYEILEDITIQLTDNILVKKIKEG